MTAPAIFNRATPTLASRFNVPDLRCAACIAKIEAGLTTLPGVVAARVNFTTKQVRVDHLPELDDAAIVSAIASIGFTGHPFVETEAESETHSETRILSRALAVAGFAAMNVMLLSVSVWSGATGTTRDLFHWLSAMIALPAVAYAGRPFFRSAWGALRQGRTNMDVPISIGVVLTCALSLFETATGGEHAYFDGAVMLLFFLLAGRLLDSVMRARAASGVAALMRATPGVATALMANGATERRTIAELAPGMRILVAAGERIAADGAVEAGQSSVDCALVTGESLPEAVAHGSPVLAGTINLDAPLTIKITAVGDSSVIAEIARLMEAATQSRSRYVRYADRAARLYAPAVHSLAALSFIGWMIAGAGWHQSILIAVAVLIITCPCALGLAVPVSQVVAAGALMRAGVIIKDGSALERLSEIDGVVFDKTGTLTLGRPEVTDDGGLAGEDAAAALGLAQASRHPLSQALAAWLADRGTVAASITSITEVPGSGVEGWLDGARIRLGRVDWIVIPAIGDAMTIAYEREGGALILVTLDDALRPDAGAAVLRLKALGLPLTIFSGDREPVVARVGHTLGIAGKSGLSPQAKLARINEMQGDGRRLLMVGDGLNDGPALKAAHVSMAPASASNVGQAAADLVFLGDRLNPIPVAIGTARATMRVVRQNFGLAVGYNLLAVPLAMAGLVTPLVAALAMSGSSLIVVANALRLRGAAR